MRTLAVWGSILVLSPLKAKYIIDFCNLLEISHTQYKTICNNICNRHKAKLCRTAKQLRLPLHNTLEQLVTLYIPFSLWLKNQSRHCRNLPFVVGINGAQGSGKTTLCAFAKVILEDVFKLSCVSFSMDDILLGFDQRSKLATDIHPLLNTRGPGTHDIKLGIKTLCDLQHCNAQKPALIPHFDKALKNAQGDRTAQSTWKQITTPPRIVLLEGWNTGQHPKQPPYSNTCVNALETKLDPDCKWKNYVDTRLESEYKQLWNHLNSLVMLKIPNMEYVFKNRKLQEEKLNSELAGANSPSRKAMTPAQVENFVRQYESDTLDMLKNLPQYCNLVIKLDGAHTPFEVQTKNPHTPN